MYFLGFAGCVQVDGIRIAGASGIYNERNYRFGRLKSDIIVTPAGLIRVPPIGHFEQIPFDDSTMRSIYHTREFNMFRLSQVPVKATLQLSFLSLTSSRNSCRTLISSCLTTGRMV